MKMKKYVMIFAAALTLLAACQEEMTPEINTNEDGIKDYPVEMTFIASNEVGTKTAINAESIIWEDDDAIKVLWSNTGSNKAIAHPYNDNSCAQFTTKVEEAEAYYAVHPYAAASSYVDGNIVVKVPSLQGGAFENANIAVAKAISDNAFLFRHLVGIVEFTTDTPGKVTISGAEGDVLTGTVTVTGFDDYGYPQYSEDKVTDASSVIEIDVKASGTYYAAFLPSATLKCLSVKVEGSETTEYALSANQLQMARGKVIELGNIDTKFGKHLFVSASANGEGDGKTWETALTFDQMAEMLSANRNGALSDDYSDDTYKETHKTIHAAEIHDKTFHIAAGEYQTANYIRMKFAQNDTPVKVTLKGGYDANSKGTDLSKRNVATYVTKVIGAKGATGGSGTKRVFLINEKVNLTLDGLSLTDGTGDGTYGGGAIFMDQASSTLNCLNCTIANNESPINSGAVYVTAGTLDFTNCTFSKNIGTGSNSFGGALYVKNGSLTCTGCTFSENASVNNGGAVWLNAMSKADFIDCDFTSNVCTANLAGAICLSGANPLNITGGTFKGNSAPNGGCFYNNAASTINITGTKFIDNKATAGVGGVFYCKDTAGPKIKIENAEFTGNTATAEGSAIFFKNGTWTVTNTAFNNNTSVSNGGAIYAHTGTLSLTGGSFSGNKTTSGGVGGGAIYVTTNAKLTVDGTTFSKNAAQKTGETGAGKGGAICIANSAAASHTIKNATFTANTDALAGGALFIDTKAVEIDGCTFDGNSAKGHGGAIHATGAATFTIKNSTFEKNVLNADLAGGAIYSNATSTGNLISSTKFISNTTKGNGGAIYWSGTGRLAIDKSYFEGNVATKQGAAIRKTTGILYLNATSFTGNKSAGGRTAGVIRLEKDSFFNNCCFYGNEADVTHTDLVLVGGTTTVLNSTLYESNSTMACIRVYNNGVVANLYNNVLLNPNTGSADGSVRVGYYANPGSITSPGYNYTTEWKTLLDDGVAGSVTMAGTDKVVAYNDVSGNFKSASTADGRGYYTWTKTSDVTGTTSANVTAFLNGITGGNDFAAWLATVDGLTKDIAGNARPDTGWYPGCYQGK